LEDDRAAENFISVPIAASKEKSILGLFRWNSSPELNTKNMDISPVFYPLLIQPYPTHDLEDTEF
jgi:hypothetical protein